MINFYYVLDYKVCLFCVTKASPSNGKSKNVRKIFRGSKKNGVPLKSRDKSSTYGVEGAVCSLTIKSARKYTSIRHGIDVMDESQEGEVLLSNFAL